MIDGFLEIHRLTCAREDCYLKTKKQGNQRGQKSFFREGQLAERDVDLLMIIHQILSNAIKRFPNEVSLRVRYAFVLLDLLKSK